MTLELKQICLRYAKKTVLDNLSLSYKGGQLHALLGDNGAGKSTTANIICGEIKPDSGEILIDGRSVPLSTPRQAIEAGICYVHQRPMLADYISVKENILLGLKKELKKEIPKVTEKWIPGVKLDSLVKNLGADTRFFIALCIALIKSPQLLLLDEPTALLSDQQSLFLYENLRQLASEGMNIIIITHNLDEAEKYCDTIDFLEEGRLIQKKKLKALNLSYKAAENKNQDFISFKNLSTRDDRQKKHFPLKDISFSLPKGKITLIKGLAEDGLDSLEGIITGMNTKGMRGTVLLTMGTMGTDLTSIKYPVSKLSPALLRHKLPFSVGIIPTDRKFTGSNPKLSVSQMLTSGLSIPESDKNQAALEMIEKSGVNIRPEEKCSCLSGGMLQKLMFERELYEKADFLILCNPLQGLDTASSIRTCSRIKEAVQKGTTVLILSYGAFPWDFCDNQYRLSNGRLEAL